MREKIYITGVFVGLFFNNSLVVQNSLSLFCSILIVSVPEMDTQIRGTRVLINFLSGAEWYLRF
jgi:hypothetical protein